MNQRVLRGMVAVAACGMLAAPILAEEPARPNVPTLLIKGDVLSVDKTDPAAPLLKVKDRYGFETPIYLTPETKVTQGDQAATVESLNQGASVEVEYNFDINTAKRHAVSVKLSAPSAPAASSEPAAAPAAAVPAASTPAMPDAMAAPAAAAPVAAPAPAAPSEPAPADESNTVPEAAGQ